MGVVREIDTSGDLSALAWVSDELRRSLESAHKSLRRYLKEADAASGAGVDAVDPAILRHARTQFHQGVGALELVGLPMAAQMLRASEAALVRIAARPKLATLAAVETIERGSFALLDYLARQLAGKTLSPLAMFPQYRALQELAGATRIHPADLWPIDWQWRDLPGAARGGEVLHADELTGARIEAEMLTLMRGLDPGAPARMSDLFAGLSLGVKGRLSTLWQLASAFFEAQAAGLLKADVYSKRVASRLLAQLRAGDSADPSERLAQDLLFFCSQSTVSAERPAGPRLEAVRKGFSLSNQPPIDYEVGRLGRFDPALLLQARKRVAGAKDVWSTVAGGDLLRLPNLSEQFALVGDSLQRLYPEGGALAQALQQAAAQTVAAAAAPPAELAMEVATGLLYLDASLEDVEIDHPDMAQRIARLAQRIDDVRHQRHPAALEVWMEDLYRRVSDRQTMGSVVQELRVSLSEVEKQIDQYFRNPAQRNVLIPVPGQLQSMRGVLSVLGLDQASQAVVRMRDDIEALAHTDAEPELAVRASTFDRLADNLGALSFLIDMLSVQPQMAKSLFTFDPATGDLKATMGRAHRPSGFGMLEVATSLEPQLIEHAQSIADSAMLPMVDDGALALDLDSLSKEASSGHFDDLATTAKQARAALTEAADGSTREAVRTALARTLLDFVASRSGAMASQPAALSTRAGVLGTRSSELGPVSKPMEMPAPRPTATPATAQGTTGLEEDDEMRDVFLEEAREVVQTAQTALAELSAQDDVSAEMTSVRRAFHTLKGSSRMVGLKEFGEAAWSCEQLYNARLAEASPRADADLIEVTREALDYFKRWIEAIALRSTAGFERRAICVPVDALRQQGQRMPPGLPPQAASERVAPASLQSAVPNLPSARDLDMDWALPQPEAGANLTLPTGEAVAPVSLADMPTQVLPRHEEFEPEVVAAADVAKIELDLDIAAPGDETTPITDAAAPMPAGPEAPSAEPVAPFELPIESEQFKVIGPLRISIALFNIYLNEADELSRRLATEVAEWSHELHRPVGEIAIARAHSLAGSSATVGYTELSQLARSLEHALMRSNDAGCGTASEARLFNDTAHEIRRLLHQFAAGFLKPASPDLVQRLFDHEHAPPAAEVLPQAQSTEPPVAEQIPLRPSLPETSGAQSEFAELAGTHFAALTGTQFADFGQTELKMFSDLPEPIRAAIAARADALDDEDDIDVVDAIDPELFPIFEEEAMELIPQLQSRVRDWVRRPSETAAASACMRTLHTLKGGARLAGAMVLGEMAHRMETAIEHVVARGQTTELDVERLTHRVDAIESAFEAMRRGEPLVSTPMPLADYPVRSVAPLRLVQEPAAAPAAPDAPAVAAAAAPTVAAAPATAAAPPAQAATVAPAAQVERAALTAAPVRQGAGAIDWSRFAVADDGAAARVPEVRAARASNLGAVRVRAPLLDRLVNHAGEVSITRARIEADVGQIKSAMGDLGENLERLRSHLRDIELQAETQIASRIEAAKAAQSFDPLEMDRFTRFQELTRMMAESVNDVATVQRSLQRSLQSTEDELAAQERLTRDLQDDLLRTRMVEFEGLSERFYRVVRQAAKETGKQVRLDIIGGAIEIDRGVLDRMLGSFEHLLRNCVTHGIEAPEVRAATGKDATGTIVVAVAHEGNEVSVEFRDDGAGLDMQRIRAKGLASGLLAAGTEPTEVELANLIFMPGFSTAESVTELAGRGVGMDVVRSEVNAMGGRIVTATAAGKGTSFRLVLPLTTAVTQVVLLRCGEITVAVPSTLVEIVRLATPAELERAYGEGGYALDNQLLPFFWLGALLQASARGFATGRTTPIVVVRSAAQRLALHVDEVVGNQEVVVKNLGPQMARLPGLAGMTLLPSGAPTLIYNPVALATMYGDAARTLTREALSVAGGLAAAAEVPVAPLAPLVLVVDDSLTVRRVTQRLLLREGYRVVLAKDGLEGLERLGEERPAVVLSDIEMPRMDGFDLVRNMRADARLADLPVIMITSRIAQKHRDYAAELGVDHYLGKPYSEEDLLALVARYAHAEATSH